MVFYSIKHIFRCITIHMLSKHINHNMLGFHMILYSWSPNKHTVIFIYIMIMIVILFRLFGNVFYILNK